MMGLVAPLAEFIQFVGDRLKVSCSTNPGVAGVQKISALSGAAGTMVSVGAPVTCTVVDNAQKPPVTAYWPLVIGPPASG